MIFSPLQIVLMVKNEPLFFPLYNIAVVFFFCISPTQCKVYYIITITAESSA